ncbi:MAG: hypothetical protein RH942_04070 [Kiloniellaceae bacterium]
MPRPLNIIELAITEDVANDATEIARRLDEAAELVEGFAKDSAISALEALLAAADEPAGEAAEKARLLATEMSDQTEIMHSEIERFLAVSAGQRPN